MNSQINAAIENTPLRPSAARLVEGLRDTGYTFTTAVADIMDNSVAADASSISLNLELDFANQPVLFIADNGNGMDHDELIKAMTYGSPKRPSPKSLGKFGMGLKTASTSFCKKLTVISKKGGLYSTAQWDLDFIAASDEWLLRHPSIEEYAHAKEFLDETASGGKGTVVIWEHIDRLVRMNSEGTARNQINGLTEDLRQHLSGVFYNFLTDGNEFPDLDITINNEPLEGWDPFCRWMNEDGNRRVDIHINNPIVYSLPSGDSEEEIGRCYVNAYILPNKDSMTPEELKKTRYSLNNQGFHIFREGRMIVSGGWPNRLLVKEPHLNLLRIECSFDHKLDDIFQIDIKKSRIDFPKELRDELKRIIGPPKNEANRRYRRGNKAGHGSGGGVNIHKDSSNAIDRHLEENTSSSQIGSTDVTKGEAEIRNKFGTSTVKIKFEQNSDRVVQSVDNLQDGVLWMPGLVEGNKHAVFLNESHEFYKRFYLAHKGNSPLVLAMDALLWSLAEAELSVFNDNIKRNLEHFRISVSHSLRTLAAELPEIEESENDTDGAE